MTIVDSLNQIWNTILETMALFVIPDWSAIIGLLPVLIFLGVVGPLTDVPDPRRSSSTRSQAAGEGREVRGGPAVAQIGADGQPVFPPGLPHCRRDALIYESGTDRCERCHDALAVICPMCGLGRLAVLDTCTNCGLVLKVKPRAVVLRATPPARSPVAPRRPDGPTQPMTRSGTSPRGDDHGRALVRALLDRRHLRRARVRGPCRARRHAGQRPRAASPSLAPRRRRLPTRAS